MSSCQWQRSQMFGNVISVMARHLSCDFCTWLSGMALFLSNFFMSFCWWQCMCGSSRTNAVHQLSNCPDSSVAAGAAKRPLSLQQGKWPNCDALPRSEVVDDVACLLLPCWLVCCLVCCLWLCLYWPIRDAHENAWPKAKRHFLEQVSFLMRHCMFLQQRTFACVQLRSCSYCAVFLDCSIGTSVVSQLVFASVADDFQPLVVAPVAASCLGQVCLAQALKLHC